MPRRLIVNADDFGLTPGINQSIAELHDAGAVSSATLMAGGPAFEHAVALAKARPALGTGCHVVLTDGTPVSRAVSIPSLVPEGHRFRAGLGGFVAALLTNQIDPEDIEREAIAQIQRMQQAGLTVTHLDTHKHTHIFPSVAAALFRAAARTGVAAVRNPFEQPWSFRLSNGDAARTSQLRLVQLLKRPFFAQPALASGRIQTTDGTVGISATGSLDERSLRSLLASVPEGTWELVCHPGYIDTALDSVTTRLRETREVEHRALLAVLSGKTPAIDSNLPPLTLIHYGDLTS